MVQGYINGMVPAWVPQRGCPNPVARVRGTRASSGTRRASPGM